MKKSLYLVLSLTFLFTIILSLQVSAFATELELQPGDIVIFGEYEQDNRKSNGPEPIEWIVLESQDNYAFLLSRYVLDCQPYNKEWKDMTWEECSLRAWLNDSFYETAFNANEKDIIATVLVDNSSEQGKRDWKQSGEDTVDRVFLLSYAEVREYFEDREDRVCRPTSYAIEQGVWQDKNDACHWWLRSPGSYQNYAAYTSSFGSLSGTQVNNKKLGIRPSIVIDLSGLSSDLEKTDSNISAGDLFEEGLKYYRGDGTERDYDKAVERFQEAAEAGSAEAMGYLGRMYQYGMGVEVNYDKAIKWYEEGTEAGDSGSVTGLGMMYYYGFGVEKNYTMALNLFQKAAESYDGEAMRYLGMMFQFGLGLERNYEKAIAWYEKGVEAGDLLSMYFLGTYYYHGNLLDAKAPEPDYDKALEWFLKAADKGESNSMYYLGMMYENGEGVTQDYESAMEWYRQSVKNGDKNSLYRIGLLYENGLGVEQDYSKAVEYYQEGADWGHSPQAEYYLAHMYEEGKGVKKDIDRALELYREAAEQHGYYPAEEKVTELENEVN